MKHFFKCFWKKLASSCRVNAKTSGIWQTIDNFFKQRRALKNDLHPLRNDLTHIKERFVRNKYIFAYHKTLFYRSLFILLLSKGVENLSAQSWLDSFFQAKNCLSHFKGGRMRALLNAAPRRPCAAIICHNDELSWRDCLLTISVFFIWSN